MHFEMAAMADSSDNLVVNILREIQTRLGRIEERLTNLEVRMTAQEQHLGTLVIALPASHYKGVRSLA